MQTLNVIPRGDVEVTFSWGSESIDFRNGSIQKHRKRVRANKTIKFTVSGKKNLMDYLITFYNEHYGQLEKFYFVYDSITEICTFGDKLSITEKRELQNIVGFECEILLSVDSQSSVYEKVNNTFDFVPRGEITEEIDWNTNVLDMGVTGRVKTYNKPRNKYTMTLSGLKKTRDKLINFYNNYGDFDRVIFNYNGESKSCLMPESLVITDKRELSTIVGFECEIELIESSIPNNGTPVNIEPMPDEEERPLWFWSYNGRYYNGTTSTQFLRVFAIDENGNVELVINDDSLPTDLWVNHLIAGQDHVHLLILNGNREDKTDNMKYITYNASKTGQWHGNNTVFQSYGSNYKPTHIDCDSKEFGRRVGSAFKGNLHSFNINNASVGYDKALVAGRMGTYPAFGYLVDPKYDGGICWVPIVAVNGTFGGSPCMMIFKSTMIHFYVYPNQRVWAMVKTIDDYYVCVNYQNSGQYHIDNPQYLMSDDIYINGKQYNLYQFIHEPFQGINYNYDNGFQTPHNVLSILDEGTPIQKLLGRKLWDMNPIERAGKINVICNEKIYLYDSSDVPHVFWYDFRDDTCFLPLNITRVSDGKYFAITAERKTGNNPNAKAGSMYDNSDFPNYEICVCSIEGNNVTKLITLDMLEDKFVDPYYAGYYRSGITPYLARITNGTTFIRSIKDGVAHVKSGVVRNFN